MGNQDGYSNDKHYDVVIKGGTVYTGTIDAPKVQDVGIAGDRIAAVGNFEGLADRIIDASGCIVTPGFIDIHTHCDMLFQQLSSRKHLAYEIPEWKGNYCYIFQGVTTVVTGNCGYGFTDTAEWLDLIGSLKFGTNVYHLVPHGVLRLELFGTDQPERLSNGQLELFKNRVSEEMSKGAIGLSTGLSYAPGCMCPADELVEVAKVVRNNGGFYASHIRDETGKATAGGDPAVISAINELIDLGNRAEIPVQLSHVKIMAPFNNVSASQILGCIDSARSKGLDITADQYPYEAGLSFINLHLPDKFKTSMSVKPEFKTGPGRQELIQAIDDVFAYFPPEKWTIVDGPHTGKTLKEIAAIESKRPADVYLELVCLESMPHAIFFNQDANVVRQLATRDYVFTGSDGCTHLDFVFEAHPRMYGTFTKKIKQFALDEKTMDLTSVIRSMTSLPAQKIGAKDRGMIATGYHADIAVIDLNTLEAPASYEKANVYSRGVTHLFVNGVMEIEQGKATGKQGGKALRKTA